MTIIKEPIWHSNALAFVTQPPFGQRQAFVTVQFEIIHGVTYPWMTCGFMRLATLQVERKLQKCIRMGITIFKNFIWGGISSDIRLEITFYSSARESP